MGIHTKLFGPHAWITLEGVARHVDILLGEVTPLAQRVALLRVSTALFVSFGALVPCVCCRQSYTTFLANHDVFHLLDTKSACYFVWLLHDSVNRKLAAQQTPSRDSSTAIDFDTALVQRFKTKLTHKTWWYHCITFLGYTICDLNLDQVRCRALHRLFTSLGVIVGTYTPRVPREQQLFSRLHRAIECSLPALTTMYCTQDNCTEFDALWQLNKNIMLAGSWQFPYTHVCTLQAKCEAGRVACPASVLPTDGRTDELN
jgi:hypothetical protein